MTSARELLEEGKRLRWSRELEQAILVLEQAARLAAEPGEPSQLLAECLSWLGLVHSLAPNNNDSLLRSIELQREALAIEETLYGENHERVAETLRLLGATLAQAGRTQEAYDVLSRSVAIARSLLIENRSSLDALARLADAAFDLGRYEEAARVSEEYLRLPLAEPLSQLEEMAGHMRAGRARLETNAPAEAIEHFERNLEIARSRRSARGIAEMEEWVQKARLAASGK